MSRPILLFIQELYSFTDTLILIKTVWSGQAQYAMWCTISTASSSTVYRFLIYCFGTNCSCMGMCEFLNARIFCRFFSCTPVDHDNAIKWCYCFCLLLLWLWLLLLLALCLCLCLSLLHFIRNSSIQMNRLHSFANDDIAFPWRLFVCNASFRIYITECFECSTCSIYVCSPHCTDM